MAKYRIAGPIGYFGPTAASSAHLLHPQNSIIELADDAPCSLYWIALDDPAKAAIAREQERQQKLRGGWTGWSAWGAVCPMASAACRRSGPTAGRRPRTGRPRRSTASEVNDDQHCTTIVSEHEAPRRRRAARDVDTDRAQIVSKSSAPPRRRAAYAENHCARCPAAPGVQKGAARRCLPEREVALHRGAALND
jgi:hypothetical protein